MSSQIERAKKLAEFCHHGQKYGDKDYMYHIEGVVSICKQYKDSKNYEQVIQAAYLHDTIEDSGIEYSVLEGFFNKEVVHAIKCLSKVDTESEDEYIQRVKSSSIALQVKKADALFNLTESILCNHVKRITKYTNVINKLNQ